MYENKFYLRQLFKENNLEGRLVDKILWDQLPKKIKPYQNEIKKNIRKMGDFESENISDIPLKDIYDEYHNLWKKERTVKGADLKKLKTYFQILFPNPNEGVPSGLYDNSEQFDDFLETLIKKNRQTYLRRLFSELLYHYPKDNPLLFKRLEKIYNNLDKNRRGHQLLIKANAGFQLTDKKSPRIIAENILDIKKDLSSEILSQIWLKERHLISDGIGGSIVEELCLLIESHIQAENGVIIRRFLEYLSGDNAGENKTVRFIDQKPVVQALLIPFEQESPTEPVKKKITKFLDQYIGDPRSESEKWISMEREKSIFLKWKIGETLKDFFALLSYTAKQNPDADRMWPYRKEFIKAYHKQGHIKDAWIVLGKKDYKNRLNFLKENFEDYGKLSKGGYSDQSVLIFKIGDLVLSEWNYNGKVRLWNKLHKNCPQFYKKEYSRDDLIKKSNKEFSHHDYGTPYRWQKNLSLYIEKYTGIPCPEPLQRKINQFQ